MAEPTDRPPAPESVGLLCGGGALPLCVARSLRARGTRVVAVGIKGMADEEVAAEADEFSWTGLARLGGWIRAFRRAGVGAVMLVGWIRKPSMFASLTSLMPDMRSLRLWRERLRNRNDHEILGAVVEEFEREGFTVRGVPELCPELLVGPGRLSKRTLDGEQWADVRFAWPIAKQVAALQVGQCIVVKGRAVVAVEAMEGTDEALRRGGRLARGGAVAVKVARPGHDMRYDIPCMGPDTVATLREAGVDALAVEAGCTILLEPDEVARRADKAGIALVAVTDPQARAETPPSQAR